jgi:hypothetical protein
MGKKTVQFSDLSGEVLRPGDDVVRLVVLEHPDLFTGPVQLEALPGEIEKVDDAALDVAVVEVHDGAAEPRRIVMSVDDFDALATDVPMAQLLKTAERVRPAKAVAKAAAANGDRLDYATLAHAGKPHRGKITVEEAQIVREHLDEVNERLVAEGLRPIDPANPEHASRYGLPSVGEGAALP